MKIKKVISIISVVITVSIVLAVVWIKFVPVNELDFVSESDSPIASVMCSFPIKVSGSSMTPLLENGETVIFSKCFDEDDLLVNKVITYEDGSVQRIGVIREVKGEVYKVSNEARPEDIRDVQFEDVSAIYNKETSE